MEQELHILLVDDDEDDALIIKDLLNDIQRVRLKFHWAHTYEEGEKYLDINNWSAILVDYDLGRKNGLDFIREASSKEVKAPMIMVTGRGRYEIDLEAMQAGAADYLSKDELNSPFLERTIRYALERKRVEEELERRVEERTREIQLLLDQTPAVLWTTDRQLRVTSVQGKSQALLGRRAEEIVGKSIQVAFPSLNPEQEARMIQAHQQALEGQSIVLEVEVGKICLSAHVEPFHDDEQYTIGCIGTALDVTERKAVETAQNTNLALFEGLFNASPDAILLILSDGIIQRANHQAEVIFGYSQDELEGLPVERLIPARFHDVHGDHRAEYNAHPRTRPMGAGLRLFGLRKNGQEFPVDVILSPLLVNEHTYVICVVRDMDRGEAAQT